MNVVINMAFFCMKEPSNVPCIYGEKTIDLSKKQD